MMVRPLEDVRILDLTSGPAGGIATMILADFGAEVLMIER
ncbi:MAG: CoA transferase, partial [Pseudomonadales bacterium]